MPSVKPRALPAPTVLRGVRYDVYVGLRDDPRNRGLRMTYHDGVPELTSSEFFHEKGASRLSILVRAYAAAFRVPCQGTRHATFRRGEAGRVLGYGKEPDESFYFGDHAEQVRQRNDLDPETDPPPDLCIETDHRSSSAGRLSLYAALGVPEVWRYRPRSGRVWFGRLEGAGYVEVERSGCLPRLTAAVVRFLLDEAERRNETEWDLWMRGWFDTDLRLAGPDVPPA